MLLHNLILRQVAEHGDRPALIFGDNTVSYTELVAYIESAAAGLVKTGLKHGERVAVYLNKRPEAIVSYFASSMAGGVFVPVNSVLKPTQVRHILDDCTVSVLITSASYLKTIEKEIGDCRSLHTIVVIDGKPTTDDQYGCQSLSWGELTRNTQLAANYPRRIDNDVVSILYTSGSTGKPKGVVLSHRNMVTGAESVASYIENTAEDRILAALPFSFDAGFSQLTTGFSVGAAIVLMDYLLPQDVLKAVARHSITGITGVPPLWNQLAKLSWSPEAAKNLRYIATTGGAMPTATLEELRNQLPNTKVFLMYGLTESFRSTYLPPEELDGRPTSIGKAIPNAEILVVRDDGSICDPGEPGELVHRGALVSLGYWNDPKRTAERFKPLPNQPNELSFQEMTVWSGDTVFKDDEGFLFFVGRRDDMIKSSGYRVSPTEIEEVIYKSGVVGECAAIGIPHPSIGQAIIVVANGPSPDDSSATEILKACRTSLAHFMVPAKIVWKKDLPKNPNGKIDRKQLVDEFHRLFEGTT